MADERFAFTRLNGTNWQTWKVRIESLLQREDLWDVVENAVPAVAARKDEWVKADRRAKATLILLLEDSQLTLVKNCVFARDVYNTLKNYHQKTTRSVRVSLLKKLCSTNLAEDDDVESHLRVFDDLFDRLEAAGMKLDKDTKVCMLLRSLPPSYDGLVTALDSRSDDDVSLDVVKSRLVDEFNRHLERKCVSVNVEKAMRSSGGRWSNETRTCYYCKKIGHLKRNCPEFLMAQQIQEERFSAAEGNVTAEPVQGDRRSVAFTIAEEFESSWVIDSGASAHVTSDKSFFKTLRKFDGDFITLADGRRTRIRGEGSGILYGIDGAGETTKIVLQDVKFVPGFSTKLISVGKLVEKEFKVTFNTDGCDVVDTNGVVVVTGSRHGRLYYLRAAETSLENQSGLPGSTA